MKTVTCQVKYIVGDESTTKTYSGLNSELTNEQIAALSQFFIQLTNASVASVYKITKEEVEIDG